MLIPRQGRYKHPRVNVGIIVSQFGIRLIFAIWTTIASYTEVENDSVGIVCGVAGVCGFTLALGFHGWLDSEIWERGRGAIGEPRLTSSDKRFGVEVEGNKTDTVREDFILHDGCVVENVHSVNGHGWDLEGVSCNLRREQISGREFDSSPLQQGLFGGRWQWTRPLRPGQIR